MSNSKKGAENDRVMKMIQKKNEVVGYHKFLNKYPKNKCNPICFVEGNDEKYYYQRVKLNCNNIEPLFIKCGNKAGVIDTFSKINGLDKFEKLKLFYFIDSDFDDKLNNPQIYETEYYSIENFYTTPNAFLRIIKNEFRIDDDEVDFQKAINIFKERQTEFHEAMLLLNAWISCQIDLQRTTKKRGILRLNDKKLKEFISIGLEKVESNYDKEKLLLIFPESLQINANKLDQKISEFKKLDKQRVFRGKYEIEFLKKILDLIKIDINSQDQKYFFRDKKVSIIIQDIISQFSIYAENCDFLNEYVISIWQEKKMSLKV